MVKMNFARKICKDIFRPILKYTLNLSLFNKIFYGVIIIVFFIIMVSSASSFLYIHNARENEAMNNAERLVNNINTGFEDNLDQINRIIMSIYADTGGTQSSISMQDVLSTEDYTSLSDEYTALKVTKDFFQRLIFLRKDFNSIYIYVSKSKIFSFAVNGANKLDYDPVGEEWFKKTVEANGNTLIFAPHIPYQLYYNKQVISFSRLLKNTGKGNSQPDVVILADLSMNSIDSIVDKVDLGSNTSVLFLDGAGKVIYSKNAQLGQEGLGKDFIDRVIKSQGGKFTANILKQKYLVAFKTSEVTGWKLLTLTPYSEVSKDDEKLLLFYLLLMLVALLITIVLSYGFSRIIFKPVKRLQKGITKVKAGNFDFQLEKFSEDELGQLILSFNSMILTIKTLIVEKYEETIARKDAEFKYLQAQINPHFIYNTLQIISSMAVVKKVPEISNVSKSLAKMLRYSISGRTKEILIKEELDNLVSYLEIQKLRFRDFVNYTMDIHEEVYGYSIVKLVLQPIVENSVTHGIEAKGQPGMIEITGRLIENEIHISILDNGKGMPGNQIDGLLKPAAERAEGKAEVLGTNGHHSVGVRNIDQRLKLFYGPDYGLDIKSVEGEWTRVTVRIPARRLAEEN